MFAKVSVLVPTRMRIDRLRLLLESFTRTTTGALSELIFRIDDDDYQTYDFLSRQRHLAIVGPRLRGYGSIPEFFNEMAEFANGDVLMAGNDDMVFRTVGWDEVILSEANKYPDGVFDFGVRTHNEANFPFATVSKRMVDKVGFFFNPRLFWGDIFWRDVTSYFNRALSLPEVEIDHDWAGFRPDQVFADGEIVRRSGHMHLHGAEVAVAVEKMKELMQ